MHGHTTLLNTASGGDPSLLKALAFIGNRASQFSDTLERMYRRPGTTDRLTTVLQAQRCGLLGLQLGFAASPP